VELRVHSITYVNCCHSETNFLLRICIRKSKVRSPAAGRGGPWGSGLVKAPDYLDISALQGW